MSLSPDAAVEMQEQIKAAIRRGPDGFFDNPKDAEDLQATVRIVCEFYLFLRQSGEVPDCEEAECAAGTIRSGMDWFFSMAQTGSILSGLNLKYGFNPTLPKTFSELKASYNASFQQLLECTRSAKAVGLLLSCVQMMLFFMAAYFPSFSSFSEEATTKL
jgi:hypothetical protein